MSKKTRLELTWVGKDERPRLEPRIFVEDAGLSFHANARQSENDIFDNVLIHGDNLLALKSLEAEYAGRIDCIFIDPPYNTGSAFEHYDDGLEHSLWLSMIRDRLEIIRRLLSDKGSLWITIDDNESHYLKVLCDEIFGRSNFIANIVWQKRTSRENRAAIGSSHDHILVYATKPAVVWKQNRNKLVAGDAGYSNPDGDPKGVWKSIPFSAQGYRPNQMYKITTPTGVILDPPPGRCWGATEPIFQEYLKEGRVYFPKGGDGRPRIKQYPEEQDGLVPTTWWPASECADNEAAKKESIALFGDNPFATPKPEALLERIITIATNPGDLVMDSFAGSGTTGAVAHKMHRRWIMIELGDHAVTHVAPRLRKVISGDDSGGVTNAVGWKGGGGFRFRRVATSLLKKDHFGNWVISKEYNGAMLAEALCKHLGFVYAPSQDPAEYWRHGHSTETDFIYVTTQSLTYDALKKLSEEVGPTRTLLVCCKAFNAKEDSFSNLTVKKIPHSILSKCEWGRDDYSLRIANLPNATVREEGAEAASDSEEPKASKPEAALPLFDNLGGK